MIEMFGRKYINQKEVSKHFPFSGRWFEKARYDNKGIPYIRIGNKIMYSIDDVENWFKDNMITSYNDAATD